MEILPEHIVLDIATYGPRVWYALYGTCRRLSALLHYHHPLWETVFLTKTVLQCHTEYRLKTTGHLHRLGGKPAVIAKNCRCRFNLVYVCRDEKNDMREFCLLALRGDTDVRIYARHGCLYGEIGNRPEPEPIALVSSSTGQSLAIHTERGGLVDKVIRYRNGKRMADSGSILVDNIWHDVTFPLNRSRVVVIPTRPGWSDFVKMLTFIIIVQSFNRR
jgi:hypothetical protein